MGKSLQYLMNEVDDIIEKRAFEEPPVTTSYDNEIAKVASDLVANDSPMVGNQPVEEDFNFVEKLAYSLALTEAYINMPYLTKLASFEKKAYEQGYTAEQVEEQLMKTGAADRYVPLSQVMDMQPKRKKKR